MLKSMTAYGRATLSTRRGRFVAEIQSVNRKHLEINTFLPPELMRFDRDVRSLIGAKVFRGQVTVKLLVQFDDATPIVVTPNLPLARQLKQAWDAIADDLQLEASQRFTLRMLVKEPGILLYGEELKDETLFLKDISEVIDSALQHFLEMRVTEGAALEKDIADRLSHLKKYVEKIAELAPNAPEKYRQKLRERLEEVIAGAVDNEERILREVCLFAERVDITEEVIRFRSHLKQCEEMLHSDKGAIGKTLEFLLQELNREVNTIGSKASDAEVTKYVVAIKSELERIREQIQNVE